MFEPTFFKEPTFQHNQPLRTAVLLCNLGTPDAPTPTAASGRSASGRSGGAVSRITETPPFGLTDRPAVSEDRKVNSLSIVDMAAAHNGGRFCFRDEKARPARPKAAAGR